MQVVFPWGQGMLYGDRIASVKFSLAERLPDGRIITKRYKNATAYVNPTTNLLQVYRNDGPSSEDQEMLAEFQADTYLYWE
jgi:hypothetical protein